MIKINKLTEKQDVYDIQVPETSCFYGNNILVHNSTFLNFSPIKIYFFYVFNSFFRYFLAMLNIILTSSFFYYLDLEI